MSSFATDAVAPALTKKGNATRKALLDSTIELIASTGYAATTTQAVLDHSGISRGSLLHQFKTREHLMVAAALEAVERMFVGASGKDWRVLRIRLRRCANIRTCCGKCRMMCQRGRMPNSSWLHAGSRGCKMRCARR